MTDQFNQPNAVQLMALGSFRLWIRLLLSNRGFEPRYWQRVLLVTLLSGATAPLKIYERTRYTQAIKRTQLEPPVFIIGHWRSGTTYLLNLLAQNPAFGYSDAWQILAPDMSLIMTKAIKAKIGEQMPTTRPVDNVPFSIDSPQEDEHIIQLVSPDSFYHYQTYPRQMQHYFNRHALFENASPQTINAWQKRYLHILKKTALYSGKLQLLVKNPIHTVRIPLLLEMFPDAKFIHMVRNPYVVYPSTIKLFRSSIGTGQLHSISEEQLNTNILYIYRRLMQQFLADTQTIPEKQFIEIRFEDLETDPIRQVERIYQQFDMPDFEAQAEHLRDYLEKLGNYKKNAYPLDQETIHTVQAHWQFALDHWQYGIPEK